MTKKGEEDAELQANTTSHPPKWHSGRYDGGNADKEGFVEGSVLWEALPERDGPHLMNGRVRRPRSTSRVGKLRYKAAR